MLNSSDRKSVDRRDFLKKLANAGFKYDDAAKIYDCIVSLFADAIVSGNKICIGRVLSISPVKKKPRKIRMNFKHNNRTIILGDRLKFQVNVYDKFINDHELKWPI